MAREHNTHLLIIDGPIGSGKSSVIYKLSSKINALIIPEYIEEPKGVYKLNEYLNDKSKYAYQFQEYILNHYRQYIKDKTFSDYDYVLMERNPTRGIKFFARMDYNNSYISLHDFNSLYIDSVKVLTEIREALGDYGTNNVINYDTSDKTIDEVVDDIYNNYLFSDEIRLTARPKIISERINKRNREGETSAYDTSYINHMCDNYYN